MGRYTIAPAICPVFVYVHRFVAAAVVELPVMFLICARVRHTTVTFPLVDAPCEAVEPANGLGSTLGDYRTAISVAAAARPTYCTYIDGSTIITVGELSDNVHPTTAGHATYGAFVISTLGL